MRSIHLLKLVRSDASLKDSSNLILKPNPICDSCHCNRNSKVRYTLSYLTLHINVHIKEH